MCCYRAKYTSKSYLETYFYFLLLDNYSCLSGRPNQNPVNFNHIFNQYFRKICAPNLLKRIQNIHPWTIRFYQVPISQLGEDLKQFGEMLIMDLVNADITSTKSIGKYCILFCSNTKRFLFRGGSNADSPEEPNCQHGWLDWWYYGV